MHLYDLSVYVVGVWRYLIEASEHDVRSLPDVESKKSLDEIKSLSDAERWLIGFHLCRGKAKPRKVGHGQNSWSRDKHRIADRLYKIRHFKVFLKSYTSIPNARATYFVDPPYQCFNTPENGDRYPHSEIDYPHLAKWVRSRRGLVIACEGEGADYLPFRLLKTVRANTNNRSAKESKEFVYIQRR